MPIPTALHWSRAHMPEFTITALCRGLPFQPERAPSGLFKALFQEAISNPSPGYLVSSLGLFHMHFALA